MSCMVLNGVKRFLYQGIYPSTYLILITVTKVHRSNYCGLMKLHALHRTIKL